MKDMLWKELNDQIFLDVSTIVHRPMEIKLLDIDDDFDFELPEEEEDSVDDSDYDEFDWD
jgi:hypothetical protein